MEHRKFYISSWLSGSLTTNIKWMGSSPLSLSNGFNPITYSILSGAPLKIIE